MGNILRCRAVGTGWTGGPGLFTTYWRGSATPTVAEATEAAARVRAMFQAVASRIPSGITWVPDGFCDVIDEATGTLVSGVSGTTPASTTGSSASARVAVTTAVVVQWLTLGVVRGKRLRGRSFWSPITLSDLDSAGGLSTTARTAYDAAFSNALLQITTPLSMVVWSRPNTLKGYVGSAQSVNDVSISTTLGVLRSRRD